jgi:hypothetical protein
MFFSCINQFIKNMLIIAETKLDETFPDSQFEVENYHLWRADRSSHGGGMLL